MKSINWTLFFILFYLVPTAYSEGVVQVWTTTSDLEKKWEPDEITMLGLNQVPAIATIRIHPDQRFQTILGLGSSLEPATCYNLSLLPQDAQEDTIQKIVDPEIGTGMNLMRICIGTPDFTGDPWYTYNDIPDGDTDPDLEHFSIDKDRAYIIPILKLALEKNPDLLFYASPWSPPGWMTSTGDMIGGHLLPEYYEVYANYFVKFIQAYRSEGIPIYAVTIQNEPGVDRSLETDPTWHYPSCHYNGEQEREFIKNHLGPAFKRSRIDTEIWCYDHNFNEDPTADGDDPGISYPRAVMKDSQAARYVDGVAFHGYAGQPEGMTAFHREFPALPIYFTEGSTFGLKGASKIISYLKNFASSYNAWVTLLNDSGKPNNGPFKASRTLITLNSDKESISYHLDYYMYGHFMKFISRGAVRLGSERTEGIDEIAFQNPDGSNVLVLINPNSEARRISVIAGKSKFTRNILPRSIETCIW